jgi:hypothetical protein
MPKPTFAETEHRDLIIVLMNFVMLSVIMLNIVMLSGTAPDYLAEKLAEFCCRMK